MSVDQSPVYAVKAVPLEKIVANDYNPNIVAQIGRASCRERV